MSIAPHGPVSIEPGYRLDRYELLCPIAEGGMARVWLARIEGKHGFEKLVAVKMILPEFATDLQFERMLLDESRIASRIEHANVAQILDLGEHHDTLYLVLEWVEGESLSRLSRAVKKTGRALPSGVLLRILADTCGGLHAAHELRGHDGAPLGVIHRDVSPQNILVSTAGVVKLIDFGIAKARDRLVGDTRAGVLKGKVRYMAPEQALGRPVDRRADLWAIGSILYRLLAGKAPYEGENELASLNLLTSGKPPPPLPASVHPSLAAIVSRALSHAPEGRFTTAAEMQNAIESAMQAAGVVTTTSGVAAFATEHLAPYTEKRQTAVRLAMAAAADRRRVRELLRPMVSTEVSTDVSRIVTPPPPSGPTLVDVDVDGAEVTRHRAPRLPLPARPPERAGIDAPTLTLHTLTPLPAFRAPMKPAVIAAGGIVTFLVVLVALALAGRAHPKAATVASRSKETPASQAVTSTASSVPSLPPAVAASEPATASRVPVVAATDLPRATDPAPPPPPPRPATPPKAPRQPTATPAEPKPRAAPKARVDDGF